MLMQVASTTTNANINVCGAVSVLRPCPYAAEILQYIITGKMLHAHASTTTDAKNAILDMSCALMICF